MSIGVRLWLLTVAAIFLMNTGVSAQAKKFEVSAHLGYQFGAIVDETTKHKGQDFLADALGIHGAANFGIILNYHLTRSMHLELSWDQQPSTLDFIDREVDTTAKLSDIGVDYFQIGLMYNWSRTKKQPFIGMLVGFAQWRPGGDFETESGFTFAPVFGYKAWLSNNAALRAHARVNITEVPSGELFSNSGTGWSHFHTKDTWATQLQFGLALVVGW
jgi:hypothetical protein